jgi:hypothetical protein
LNVPKHAHIASFLDVGYPQKSRTVLIFDDQYPLCRRLKNWPINTRLRWFFSWRITSK